jgi:uncharacterized RDD family membrane protein YckC
LEPPSALDVAYDAVGSPDPDGDEPASDRTAANVVGFAQAKAMKAAAPPEAPEEQELPQWRKDLKEKLDAVRRKRIQEKDGRQGEPEGQAEPPQVAQATEEAAAVADGTPATGAPENFSASIRAALLEKLRARTTASQPVEEAPAEESRPALPPEAQAPETAPAPAPDIAQAAPPVAPAPEEPPVVIDAVAMADADVEDVIDAAVDLHPAASAPYGAEPALEAALAEIPPVEASSPVARPPLEALDAEISSVEVSLANMRAAAAEVGKRSAKPTPVTLPFFETPPAPEPPAAPETLGWTSLPVPNDGQDFSSQALAAPMGLASDDALDAPAAGEADETADSEGRLIFLSRTLSGLVDLVLIFLFSGIFLTASDKVAGDPLLSSMGLWNFTLLFLMIYCFYSLFFLGTNSQTIGMMVTDLRVVGIAGNRISWRQVGLRCALFLPSLFVLGLGLLMGLFNRDHLCLHDKLSGTCVVRI